MQKRSSGFMKRIVFVFDRVMHYHQDLFRNLEQRLQKHGVELWLCSGREASDSRGRVAVNRNTIAHEEPFPLRDRKLGNFTFRLATGYLKTVRKLRPDVVVCPAHPGDVGHWALIRERRRLGYRLLAWQCGYEYNPGRLKKMLLKRFVPAFDFHLAYHSNALRYALSHGADPGHVLVMHNTINEAAIRLLPKDEARQAVLQRHPEVGDRRMVLYVGAVLREKCLERLIDAVQQIEPGRIVLMVVGDGPHLDALKSYASGRNDVVFAGQVIDQVGIYFDAAEMYVLPGTGGLGIKEAMAHGLPILSSYADGSADDLVVDGENGYRLRQRTTEELVEKIALLVGEPERSSQMGHTSREWITGRFSFASFLDRVEQVLLAQAGVATATPAAANEKQLIQ